jgi:hypothetical protein
MDGRMSGKILMRAHEDLHFCEDSRSGSLGSYEDRCQSVKYQ